MATNKSSGKLKERSTEIKDTILKLIRARIHEFRKQEITDKAIADMCEVEESQISRIMSEDRGQKITLEMAIRLYYGLQIPMAMTLFAAGMKFTYDGLMFLGIFYQDEVAKIGSLSEKDKERLRQVLRAHLGLPSTAIARPRKIEKIRP